MKSNFLLCVPTSCYAKALDFVEKMNELTTFHHEETDITETFCCVTSNTLFGFLRKEIFRTEELRGGYNC